MADDRRLVRADIVDDGVEVAGHLLDRIGVDGLRRVAAAVTAHVGGDDMIARVRECGHLVPPAVGQFGPAVHEEHERPFALFDDAQAHVARLHEAFRRSGHAAPIHRCTACEYKRGKQKSEPAKHAIPPS